MVVQLAPAGLLIGADRNITSQVTLSDGSTRIVVSGQAQRPKVLKWPNHEVIVGYVGQAILADRPTDEWSYSFIGRHLDYGSLQELADELTSDLNYLLPTFAESPMIVHLGGFEIVEGQATPRIFFIRNTIGLTPGGAYVIGNKFDCSDEVIDPQYFGTKTGDAIKAQVAWPNYFSFRQGYDLVRFNTLDAGLRMVMDILIRAKLHGVPTSLAELSEHVQFQVHGYGAYFASFFPPFEQYVGGGADVVTAAWP